MSSRYRWRALVALVMALGLIAAACSSDDDGGGDSSGTTEAQELTASDTGVTADTIKIGVGVADLDRSASCGHLVARRARPPPTSRPG